MKNILSKVIASSMALTLVLASAVTTTSSIKTEEIPVKAPAAVHETVKPAATEEAKAETKSGTGLIEAIEQKAAEEAVVEVVKAAPEIKEEKAAPEITEEKAAPVVATIAEVAEEVAAPAAVIEEAEEIAAEAEPVKVWDVSATDNDSVSMKFYADTQTTEGQVNIDAQSGVVRISGTGAMEENVYRHFMSTEKFITATKALFAAEYGVEVDAVYDEGITDVVELDLNIRYYEKGTDNELAITDTMLENLKPADFLEFSPREIVVDEGITNVSDYAFLCCEGLEEVVLPSTIESIGEYAFEYCVNLKRVVVPANAEIKGTAFAYCNSLTTVLRCSDADYANMANGMVAESEGNALSTEEVNALINVR